MNTVLYQQIIHITALVGVIVLLIMGKGDALVEWTALGTLVGVALPTPGTTVVSNK